MISIFQYPETDCAFVETGRVTQEVSCKECCAAIKWRVPGQMSPWLCPKCGEDMVDASSMITKVGFRINYHLEGDNAVKCRSFVVL